MKNSEGWDDMPAMAAWKCPECGETSPADDWLETAVGCEDCGDHEARACPRCDEAFDHVWGVKRLVEANLNQPCQFCGFAEATLDSGSWICADCLSDSRWVERLASRKSPSASEAESSASDSLRPEGSNKRTTGHD